MEQSGAPEVVSRSLDAFTLEGPNGAHQCLVFELCGPSLSIIVADYDVGGERLDAEDILRISKQLLQAVATVHAAGFAHGGKLSMSGLEQATRMLTSFSTNISPVNVVVLGASISMPFTAMSLGRLLTTAEDHLGVQE